MWSYPSTSSGLQTTWSSGALHRWAVHTASAGGVVGLTGRQGWQQWSGGERGFRGLFESDGGLWYLDPDPGCTQGCQLCRSDHTAVVGAGPGGEAHSYQH